jgi:hypothetical protein
MQLKTYDEATKQFELIINMNKLFNNDLEIWRSIKDYPCYSVSNHGNVRNDKTGRILKQRNSRGYRTVVLNKKNQKIHRLVAMAFLTNPMNKPCTDHRDNNKTNNHVNNLRWVTHSENQFNSSLNKNNKTKVKGVCYNKRCKKYEVQIKINGKNIHLGYFISINDAKQARQKASKKYFGEYKNKCEK